MYHHPSSRTSRIHREGGRVRGETQTVEQNPELNYG